MLGVLCGEEGALQGLLLGGKPGRRLVILDMFLFPGS